MLRVCRHIVGQLPTHIDEGIREKSRRSASTIAWQRYHTSFCQIFGKFCWFHRFVFRAGLIFSSIRTQRPAEKSRGADEKNQESNEEKKEEK